MMEQVNSLNVAIVGGGPGCKAIMDMIFAEKLSQLRMKLIGVACTNPEAVGYRYAQEKGIYTTRDYRDLYALKDLNIIIELTGRAEVAEEIYRSKPDHVRLMDHVSARLFWDIFQIEEARIVEREQAEEELKKYRYHLEELVGERTAELISANEQLQVEIIERKDAEAATPFRGPDGDLIGIVEDFTDLTERKRAEEQREKLITELQEALAKVKTLRGLLPICTSCKKIRDDNGYWNRIEEYVRDHSEAEFSHSICPHCASKLYPEFRRAVS